MTMRAAIGRRKWVGITVRELLSKQFLTQETLSSSVALLEDVCNQESTNAEYDDGDDNEGRRYSPFIGPKPDNRGISESFEEWKSRRNDARRKSCSNRGITATYPFEAPPTASTPEVSFGPSSLGVGRVGCPVKISSSTVNCVAGVLPINGAKGLVDKLGVDTFKMGVDELTTTNEDGLERNEFYQDQG